MERHVRSLGNEEFPGNSVCVANGKQPQLTALLEKLSYHRLLLHFDRISQISTWFRLLPRPPPPPPPTQMLLSAASTTHPQPSTWLVWHDIFTLKTALHQGNCNTSSALKPCNSRFPNGQKVNCRCQASRKESTKPGRDGGLVSVHVS